MNELDVYYRALVGYRKLTTEDTGCTALRSAIAGASIEGDKITVKTATCTVDEEWVREIEKGLVHIEKAIKEERQFIRSNGEVLPIEKIKHVSKESIEHLAKHSDYITRYEEGEDIVPDKLYMVSRLSDFAVYENRFLYMLLRYLCDFVTIRYNAILELTNKYDATIDFDKTVSTGKEKLTYTVSMHDVRRDDPYLRENNPARDIIDRIDLVLKAIIAFLGTPLMEEAAKTPMLKPPITKTNVLKMNNNFKGAMALYSYIVAYDQPGYTVEMQERTIAPFRDELADELAEAGCMLSFLTYEWGLGIKPELKAAYLREEERRAAEKIKQRSERIAAMKRRLANGGVSMEEYIITIEKQLRELEGESARAEMLADEVERLKEVEKRQAEQISSLEAEIVRLNQVIIDERQRHFEEMEALKKAHEEEMHALIVKHEQEVTELKESHRKEIEELTERYEKQIAELTEQYEKRIAELIERYEKQIADLTEKYERRIAELTERYEKQIADLTEKYERQISELKAQYESRIADLTARYEAEIASLTEDYERRIAEDEEKHAREIETLTNSYESDIASLKDKHEDEVRSYVEAAESARAAHREEISELNRRAGEAMEAANLDLQRADGEIGALRAENEALLERARVSEARVKVHCGVEYDLTDKDSFNELEHEFNAFKKLYSEQWAKTKRSIRKRLITFENIKAKDEKPEKKKSKSKKNADAQGQNAPTDAQQNTQQASESSEKNNEGRAESSTDSE